MMVPFYEAIKSVIVDFKKMRRKSWGNDLKSIFYIDSDILKTNAIFIETDKEYKKYIPTSEDMMANDWYEVDE